MKNLLKRVLLCVLSLSLISTFAIGNVQAFEKPNPKPMAWPGRPGGNGDGSEEYMNGLSYGEMRGPWVYMYSSNGSVASLRQQGSTHNAIASAIVGLATTALTYGAGFWVSMSVSGLVGAGGIISTIMNSNDYSGATYSCTTYGSGRRLKIVYIFFDGDGYEITTETSYLHF